MASQMSAEERRNRVLEVVRVRGFASLPDLATELQVSESTVRRDLDFLEVIGVARRTHGGVFYTGPSPKLPHFDVRQSVEWDKKRQIAQAASLLIEPGDTILLDGGSTTYELARILVGKPLQVVTNSLPVAMLFSTTDTVDLVLIGGNVHSRTGVSLGPYANEMLAKLNVQRAVLSVAGMNQRGFYNSNLLLVETERAMIKAADEVIVVADSTKFGRSSLAELGGLSEVDVLVTDDRISDQWAAMLVDAGVRVIVAPPVQSIAKVSRDDGRIEPADGELTGNNEE
jgi:DeoR family transcriptional regulator, fructose operon transcriptional repressor